MALKAENINTIQDMQNFVTGCINDYDDGFCTKEELLRDLMNYTFRVIELTNEQSKKQTL